LKADSRRWTQVTPSAFAWERAALDWVRECLPDVDPWHAWSNFELVDDHGVAEVDLLVVSPVGIYVIEIKSRPGTLTGDGHTWTWRRPNGSIFADDNPLIGCDRKAKRLKSLVQRTRVVRDRLPFFTPLVLLRTETGGSDPANGGLDIRLAPSGRTGVIASDGPLRADRGVYEPRVDEISGMMQVLIGVDQTGARGSRRPIDPAMFNQLLRAFEQAGVRPSNRGRRVGSYELRGKILEDGPGWQDFSVRHLYVETVKRRARIWSLQAARSEEERRTRQRAAEREFTALQGIRHPNIVEAVDYVPDAERGPAVIFEQPVAAHRLDLWLSEQGAGLGVAGRLQLLRQLSDAVRYAHQRRLHHRALTPRCVLVSGSADRPVLKVRNWQVADRQGSLGGTAAGPIVSGTVNVGSLVDDPSAGYLAPEGWSDPAADGITLDVFSLGTIGYLLLTGRPPASSPAELLGRLRQDRGLLISADLDGAGSGLEEMILRATDPEVMERYQSVEEVLNALSGAEAEDQIAALSDDGIIDPLDAAEGDYVGAGWTVLRDLGRGSTARAFLAAHESGGRAVLKVALDTDSEERLSQEYEALSSLSSPTIVGVRDLARIGDRQVLVLDFAGDGTLAAWLRREIVVGLDLLERFGADLIEASRILEAAGIAHRDIKPDNLGVASRGANDELHLVLFDFSLTRAPLDAVRAGTPPYREPFLVERRRWDVAAERYAVAVTLYEMASGRPPQFGDGRSDPAVIADEATVEATRFDPAVAAGLQDFFVRALRREPAARYETAEAMLRAWHDVFAALDQNSVSTPAEEGDGRDTTEKGRRRAVTVPPGVTVDTRLAEIGMTSRLLSAASRLGVTTVGDLLSTVPADINRVRGVANQTRRQLGEWRRALIAAGLAETEEDEGIVRSADALTRRLLPGGPRRPEPDSVVGVLLGLAPDHLGVEALGIWPEPGDVAKRLVIARSDVESQVVSARKRWAKLVDVTLLRNEIRELLAAGGGVVTLEEAANALLAGRGSEQTGNLRRQTGIALVRAAAETETTMKEPGWAARRIGSTVLLCSEPDADERAGWALGLGAKADELCDSASMMAGAALAAELRTALPPEAAALSDARVVALAAGASSRAAISARLELYPKGMVAAEALARGQASVLGAAFLTSDEIVRRVRSRFPDALPLPGHPELDGLLHDVGIPLQWNEASSQYEAPRATVAGISSATSLVVTHRAAVGGTVTTAATEQAADFEERLERSLRTGGFLALVVPVARYVAARWLLETRIDAAVDLDEALVDALRTVANDRRIRNFSTVLAADAEPAQSFGAGRLHELVDFAIPAVEADLFTSGGTVLITGIGLLARYGRLSVIEDLRDRAGTAGFSLRTVWLLIPSDADGPPALDGHAIPVLGPGQWARVPGAWLDKQPPEMPGRQTA
jgi:serine/threonine protein kinase